MCHDHVYVGPGTNLRGCVIGRNTDLRAHVRVEDGTVVGDECFVGQDAVINPNVKIYPFKTVESGAIVTSSIVWESRGARNVFGTRGVRGLANVDINPEVAIRLAMAYGTSLPKGSTISTSRDTSRLARALKRALIGGFNLSGINVEDLELSTVPLTRFQVRNGPSLGGITVRLATGDPDTVEIRLFDSDGRDIDPSTQRKIELRPVRVLFISPSHPIERIAARFVHELPPMVRFVLRPVGAMNRAGSNLASYLLFEETFCRALIDLGYQDAMARAGEVRAFFEGAGP